MDEKALFSEVKRLAHDGGSFEAAVTEIRTLLARELGAKVVMIRRPNPQGGALLAAPEISDFLDSREFPFRSLHSFPLRPVTGRLNSATGSQPVKLIACFASDTFQGSLPERVTQFSAERLGELWAQPLELQRIA